MKLQKFKDNFLDAVLELLWRQWSALGIAGYGKSGDSRVIDPEALLLFSASIARYDQRLFDEMLDWLVLNERFINVQRLKAIAKIEGFQSIGIINALAGAIHARKSGLKWKSLAGQKKTEGKMQNLFFLKSGQPMPVGEKTDPGFLEYGFARNPVEPRGMSKPFPVKTVPGLLLQIRGLMGINSRSEILLYLILNRKGTIQEISEHTYYAWRSVQDVLFEMGQSSVIHFPAAKKGRVYYIDPEPWLNMLLDSSAKNIRWIGWPSLFRALEIIWLKITGPGFSGLSTLEQSAEIKMLTEKELETRFTKAGFGAESGNTAGTWGEEYPKVWMESVERILERINGEDK